MAANLLPKDVFENPDNYWEFLTIENDRGFEGQYFDRKEVLKPKQVSKSEFKKFRDNQVAETISAFANTNREGGLLVLGIAKDGSVSGLAHLDENQINSLCAIDNLVNQSCQPKLYQKSINGEDKEIILIYVPYISNAICETITKPRRAWRRSGLQNLELNDTEIERIRREKRIVDYERTHCSRYSEIELDKGVYGEFSKSYLDNSSYDWSILDFLRHIGAVDNTNEGWFTNAGKLFFSINPEKSIPHAFVRLLRFDISYEDRDNRSTPTLDKKFTGSLTKQIRDFRTFLKDSALFETYQRRKEGGGFSEEPEYPTIAVDEAVVNAVAHRDYAITRPILCEKYNDAFVVINPGNIIQEKDVPEHFSLDDRRLRHYTRNPKIMEWLREMKDPHGSAFVQALQEGTKRMRDEMTKLNLPAPEYATSISETTLILRNNASQRKARFQPYSEEVFSEYTNLYQISGLSGSFKEKQQRNVILTALKNKLVSKGWYVDKENFGRVVAHRKGAKIPAPFEVSKIVRLIPAYIFQIKEYFEKQYLLFDFTLILQNVVPLSTALNYFSKEQLLNLQCVAQFQGWSKGKITSIENDYSNVFFFDINSEEKIPNIHIISTLPQKFIKEILVTEGIQYDLVKEIKKASFVLDKDAPRKRAEYTQTLVNDLFSNIFPLSLTNHTISLAKEPLDISSQPEGTKHLQAGSLKEPEVEFSKQHSGPDVRQGITQFGSYDRLPKNIEIVPFCSNVYASKMMELIDRLITGKYKYKGSERTFGVKLTYNTVINAEPEYLEKEVNRLLDQHQEWKGDKNLPRIFLVHCPETGYPIDDENSPYYRVKRILFEAGIPCQMINTPTLLNPDWKDLNLALNIVAKCGQTPWVLPESIPDCDFFVGLSYTQSAKYKDSRLMAFANVFNQYGRWEFYSGGSEVFSFEERTSYYEQLVKKTLSKLTLAEEPTVCFHYSAKFSKEDREAILKAARSIRPKGTYVFVWINMNHNIRFYDNRAETNGSMARGKYVKGSNNQIYLSTTGHNPYKNTLGTPKALEVNIIIAKENGKPINPDLRVFASQILSLTKLNWASTDSLCAEPITTKYAGDIAYLTSAFIRQGENFKLHPVLEETPWFI